MPLRLTLAMLGIGSLAILGVARAAELTGTAGADRLIGTRGGDTIRGYAGSDHIEGRGGADSLHGGPGRDTVRGHGGNDRIAVHTDRARDVVSCGTGFDTVNAERADVVAADCELVSRQLSRDALRLFRAQSETQVEPDSFAAGSTVVTAFQSGRFVDGGAAGIGWATSTDDGRTWTSGFLERITERASDPVVAFEAVTRTWLIASLGASETSAALLVSRSADGRTWSRPEPVVADPAEHYDKEWLACDAWPSSEHRGRCYLSYLDGETDEIRTRFSTDAGRTWSPPVGVRTPGSSQANGAFPVVRPDGTLLVVFRTIGVLPEEKDAVVVARSTDGGASFAAREVIAERFEEHISGIRAPVLVTADVDAAGTVYVAWGDCRSSADCSSNDIVLTKSIDGVAWSAPLRVPLPADPDVDWFVPGISVAPGTAGSKARLALAAYAVNTKYGCQFCDTIDAWAITSDDGGRSWGPARRLNAEPMELLWLADTGPGRMLADYVSTSFVGGVPIAFMSLAADPVLGEFRQAVFATRLPSRGRP